MSFSTKLLYIQISLLILIQQVEQQEIGKEQYQEQYKVEIFPIEQTVYSGFFEAHPASGSKLYYQLFSPQQHDQQTPVLLWLEGGPGGSSQLSNYEQIGPIKIKKSKQSTSQQQYIYEKRAETWCEQYHCIFVDNPVGVGYSVSFNDYKNFFKKYDYLIKNPFYIAGESYAGHYIPALADVILREQSLLNKINLQGIAIGNGLVDYSVQAESYALYNYAASLATPKDYQLYMQIATTIQQNCKLHNYTTVQQDINNLKNLMALKGGNGTLNLNNFRDLQNEFEDVLSDYLNHEHTKISFGIPKDSTYRIISFDVLKQFKNDIGVSFSDKFKTIIPQIPVLIWSGQDDINVNTVGCYQWILNLPESYFIQNKDHLKYGTKFTWKHKHTRDVVGNVKINQNFYFAVVYKGGHTISLDVPSSSKDMITRFINQDKDWSS